uniref:Uncharacterized protein n=1 Tax=Ditylenchus dipsaci TaxID=166011 RepID=A0A915DXL4_9BILA
MLMENTLEYFSSAASSASCRFSGSGGQLLPPSLFRSVACAHCLFYIYFVTPPYSQNYETQFCGASGLLICDREDSRRGMANPINDQSLDMDLDSFADSVIQGGKNCSCDHSPEKIYNLPEFAINGNMSKSIEELELRPNLPPDFVIIVRQCCEAAAKCCLKVLQADDQSLSMVDLQGQEVAHNGEENWWPFLSADVQIEGDNEGSTASNHDFFVPRSDSSTKTCPATWDGWQCFEKSKPGVVSAKCPNYIFGDRLRNDVDGVNTVKKECLTSGQWYAVQRGGDETAEWTDYSGCLVNSAHTLKLFAGLIAFSITVIAIIPAIIVISLHRSLRKQAVFIIHRQLLYSFLFSGFFYIFNCLFFAVDGAPGDHLFFINHISCRLLFTVQLRYFRLSTFSWMLGEGVYLYRLLMCTFSSGVESLRPYFISCWGLPFLITLVYSLLRQKFDNEECWITPTKIWWIEWTIIGPCLLALSINLLLMLVVLCVLFKKLRCNTSMEPAQYTKAFRAVFMLVPVFGLHFLITIYRIQSYAHQILNLVLDGLQGFVVAMIVCYTNRTVLECIRMWLQQRREERKLRRQSEDHRMKFKRSIMERNSETVALGGVESGTCKPVVSSKNMAQMSPISRRHNWKAKRNDFFKMSTKSNNKDNDNNNGSSTPMTPLQLYLQHHLRLNSNSK